MYKVRIRIVALCLMALQIYQWELAEPGAGVELYEQCLNSADSYIIYFAELYGLESPFAEGRLQEVADTFQEFFSNELSF